MKYQYKTSRFFRASHLHYYYYRYSENGQINSITYMVIWNIL